jgi:hypothetical protein
MGVQATLKAFPLQEDPQASERHELGPVAVIGEANFEHTAQGRHPRPRPRRHYDDGGLSLSRRSAVSVASDEG